MRSRIPTQGLTVGALAAFLLALAGPSAVAEPVTVLADTLALHAGHNITLGHNVTIGGAIAAGNDVSAGHSASLRGLYAADDLKLGKDATVRGTVLANGKSQADKNLNLIGSWTAKSVKFHRDARVLGNVIAGRGDLSVDRNASITGNLLSNQNISIDKDSTVYGSARPGVGYDLHTARNVTITGSTAPGSFDYDSFLLPSMGTQPDPGSYGSQDVRGAKDSTTTLDAGRYGKLDVGKNSTLNLSAGSYTLKEFSIDKESIVHVDTTGGDVVLNVKGRFSTGKDTVFSKTGDGELVINVFDDNLSLGEGNQVEAKISVWGGNFGAHQGTVLTGNVAATGDIHFGTDSEVIFGSFGGSGGEVPEPAALAILAMGGVFAVVRHRRHRWNKVH